MDNYILGLDAKDNATPKIEKFGKKLKEVEGKFGGFGGKLSDALKELPGLGGALDIISKGPLLGFAAGLGAAAIGVGSLIKSSIDMADNMNDMAIRLGISTEKLSVLQLYANQSGSSLETLATNMGKLGVKVANGDADLKKYGVTAGSTDEALFQLADKIAKTEDPMIRLKIATDAFGKSGQEMLPLLVQGGDALRTMSEEAPIVSTELAKMADEFNDKMEVLKGRFTQIGLNIAEKVLPFMDKWLEGVDKIRVAVGLIGKAEQKQIERNKIIAEYGDKIAEQKSKNPEWESSPDWLKEKTGNRGVEINGKTLKEALADLDKKYEEPKEKPSKPDAGYLSESDQKKRDDEIKKQQDEYNKILERGRTQAAAQRKERTLGLYGPENFEETQVDMGSYYAEESQKQKEKYFEDQKRKEDELAEKQKQNYLELASAFEQNLTQPFQNFFTNIITGNESVFESFSNLFSSIAENFGNMILQMAAQMAAKAAIFGLFNLITGGAFGGSVGGFGSFVGGAIPGFATGTNYAPGGLAVVGEKGPELVNLPRGSKVTPNNKSNIAPNLTINLNGTNFTEKDVIRIATESARKISKDAKWRGKS